jgi:hypothetical protein
LAVIFKAGQIKMTKHSRFLAVRKYWRSVHALSRRYDVSITKARRLRRQATRRSVRVIQIVRERKKISRALKRYWKEIHLLSSERVISIAEARRYFTSILEAPEPSEETFFEEPLPVNWFTVADYIDNNPAAKIELETDSDVKFSGFGIDFNRAEIKSLLDEYFAGEENDEAGYWRIAPIFSLQHSLAGLITIKQITGEYDKT